MKIKLLMALIVISNFCYSQLSTDKNFVYVKTYKNAVNENTSSNDENDFNEVVTYLDGKGRNVQNILIKAGGNYEDIIFNNEYDHLNRKPKNFMPLAKTANDGSFENNFNTSQSQFYNTDKYEYTLNSYQENVYDELNPFFIREIASQGNDWDLSGGKTQKQNYILYNYQGVEDNVYKYILDMSNPSSPNLVYSGDIYPSRTLTKYIHKNENWVSSDLNDNTTHTFEDLNGRIILKRRFENNIAHDSYYIYDVQGNLIFILPPNVEHNHLFDTFNTPTTQHSLIIDKYCFQYKYDFKNRLIEKKLPGKGWEYLVYDKLNRAILSQDPNLRVNNKWNFIEYDNLGRIVYEGILTDSNNYSREQMQGVVDGLNTVVFYNGLPPFNYSHYLDQFALEVNSVSYYDDYQFNLDGINIPTHSAYGAEINLQTRNLLTGKKVRALGSNEWETIVLLFDNKDRVIKTITKSQILGTISSLDNKLDFLGNILESKASVTKAGVVTDLMVIDQYSYDKNNKLVTHQQIINNKPKELIAAFKYDELGKLENKKVGGSTHLILNGITDNNGLLSKFDPVSSWTNGTIASTSGIVNDGKLSFVIKSYTGSMRIGLSYNPSATLYTQINYALRFLNGGHLTIFENGSIKHMSTYSLEDTFEIERKDGVIYYKRNNEVFYTSLIAPSPGTLYADSHFYDTNTAIASLSVENYEYDNIVALQTVDYKYNIKGELTKINDVNSLGDDLFALEIKRNNPTATATPLYNGNLSQIFWKTANDNQLRYYDYSYDNLHRIKNAKFHNLDNSLQNDSFNLHTVNYDKNGNITFLHRAGDKMNQPNLEWMDFMTYSYEGNQLTRVLEQGHGYFGHITEVPQSDTNPQYEYDANGNLIKDRNKKIESITYNHLNLPAIITFEGTTTKVLEFVYDATGRKLKKIVNNNGNITITEYSNGVIYKKVNTNPTTLEYFQHTEGYVAHNNGSFNYVYNYTDHLGNIRLSYTDSNKDGLVTTAEIIEENNYYPFGMKHSGYNNVFNINNGNHHAQNFKFNNKEFDETFNINLYDFGARNYDGAIGRFMGIDKLSEKYNDTSPYTFALNNPIFYIDPDGNEPTPYEAALMAAHVYGDSKFGLVGGWRQSEISFGYEGSEGLKAALYERMKENGEMEYAFVFAGTDDSKDVKTNINQVLGISDQIRITSELAPKKVNEYLKNFELTFVGHSLGGALSNFSSLLTGRNSMTFNPAFLSILTIKKYSPKFKRGKRKIINFTNVYDPLHHLQTKTRLRLSLIRVGETVIIPMGDLLDGPYNGHFIGEVIDNLRKNGLDYHHRGWGDDSITRENEEMSEREATRARDEDRNSRGDGESCNCYTRF